MPPGFYLPVARGIGVRAFAPKAGCMASVTLKNVKKIYDKDVVAVQDFNLEIADKEFVVLVGPSGCGKSTTLRMVAGLEEISEGEVYIGDRLVNDVPPKDRDIAMVFQNYALYPQLSVYENIAFPLRIRHEKKDVIDQKVKNVAEILGITELLQRRPKALSGGQRQRVAIGRAIVREPQVFLMDEPLSNLDAKLRNQMRAEIIKLRKRIDTTFIYVTHDQTEAMTLGDRIVIMRDGFIMQIGTPQELFERPANKFVAGFIGTPQMNFFDARLIKWEGRYVMALSNAMVGFDDEMNAKLEAQKIPEQDIILGVRPEHMILCSEEALGHVKAKVDVSEMMGSEIYLHVTVDAADAIIRVPTADLPEKYRSSLGFGQEINFTFGGNVAHIFNKQTEERIF